MATPPSSIEENGPFEREVATSKDTAAEAKRARRSEIEKKSRLRRLDIINRMRDEVKQLENVYAAMSRSAASSYRLMQSHHGLSDFSGAASMDELQRKYSELTLVTQELEKDQAAIRRLLQEHEFYQRYTRNMSTEDAFAIWDSGIPTSLSFAAKFRHLLTSECYEFARKTYEEIRKFTECGIFDTTMSSFMGWTDKRKYYSSTQSLLFAFTKQFPSENVEELFTKTWNMFLNGSELAKMVFDASTRTRLQVLQVLDRDLLVIRRDHYTPRFPITLVSVQLMFRLQTPTGYTFCLRTIPSPEIQNATKPGSTHSIEYFNRLYDGYDNPAGCEVVHGGSVDDHDRLRSNYWLYEMVCSVLRWESSTIAPLFLLRT
ncbi:hypothetical protein PHYSODRAFT_488151 [Phytophthora sojae]|uniref:Uncharacterized protein n=1 Tax=Phytophthora sojae (strain P6497) TaxID=1094619 RepID=G4ZBG8_PHYSP|nr:hypothetical protein PHYSODRAFT_488151 [Phytophthora sojae]EGZ19890.1 hypothetical protein PHYSODRAFT_488151 [Phytophthora sojae]|eukprot:XP_009522607.1 hypothetical protein PHYSODRAFT_488151 [Phytophthora sojae]